MRQTVQHALNMAPRDVTILIEGESGTGKELFARAVHAGSLRAGQTFVAVNCGAIPAAQVKLLRALEERAVMSVGIVRLPALRERGEDLDLLLEHALEQANAELSKAGGAVNKEFSDAAKNIMLSHSWPGTVRELKNTVMRAALWPPAEIIDADAAKQSLPISPDSDAAILGRPIGKGFSLSGLLDMVTIHYLKQAMQESSGVVAKAAKLLGFENYQTLHNWLSKYGLK